jgi:hypothetical protein
VFSRALLKWLDSAEPDLPAQESCTSEFAALLGYEPRDFTFDLFFLPEVEKNWEWRHIVFPVFSRGFFCFCVPRAWNVTNQMEYLANIGTEEKVHQTIFLMNTARWDENMREFVKKENVVGFAYYPLFRNTYHKWLFAVFKNGVYWLWHVSGTKEYVVLQKADGNDRESLTVQLISLLNSNPWLGWIEAAKKEYAGEN